ncbi:MAG TPA: gliding motility-associated C-terminal domain-containing protein, partial [Flavobacteriales bacterium]|nr:gliding motility-associated C-terminal domain-containing protein [Flavobacteriales bacterium]
QLVNTLGTYGGTTAQNDGATARFTWPGAPQVSYVNFGCQAPIVPTEVTITVVSGSLCGDSGVVQLQGAVNGGSFSDLHWQGGSGTFSDTAALATTYNADPNDLGDVTLTLCATLACGAQSCTSITLPTGNAPVVTITPSGPTVLCPGTNITLTADGADTYLWITQQTTPSISLGSAGTYSVIGTSACGQDTAQITLTSGPAPATTLTPDGPTLLCPGDDVVLTAGGASSYLWNTQDTTTSITVTQAGTYTVEGSTACGTLSQQIVITSGALPQVSIQPNGPINICPGETATLTASGASSYTWSTQQGGSVITVGQAGTYTVVGTNACGNASTSIVVDELVLDASFTPSAIVGNAPLNVLFTNTSTPAGFSSGWDFGGDGTSTSTSPSHTFTEPGEYTVVLIITSGNCTSIAQVTITVNVVPVGISSLEVPNVFTPNGDHFNDVLDLDVVNITALKMTIYNRWGQNVSDISWPRHSWDARTSAGETVPDGTYFYVLDALGSDGVKYNRQG